MRRDLQHIEVGQAENHGEKNGKDCEYNEKNEEVVLTTLEFDLLLMFLKEKGRSFEREEILNKVWGNDYFGSDRVVDDLVRRVRAKMPRININTIYGFGYRLV